MEAYTSSPLPLLGRPDHDVVRFKPVYKHVVHRKPVVPCTVKKWTVESYKVSGPVPTLLCGQSSVIRMGRISMMIGCFSKNKPWISPDIKVLPREKKKAF